MVASVGNEGLVNERLSIRYERMEQKVRDVDMDEETPTVESYTSDTTYPRKYGFKGSVRIRKTPCRHREPQSPFLLNTKSPVSGPQVPTPMPLHQSLGLTESKSQSHATC